jgi:hypothetical protein
MTDTIPSKKLSGTPPGRCSTHSHGRSTMTVVKYPFAVSRRAYARRPRKSKNGTPEERARRIASDTPIVSFSAPDQSPPAGDEPGGDELLLQVIKALTPTQKRMLLQTLSGMVGRPA